MRFSEIYSDERDVAVILGDGTYDRKVVRNLAEKFDGGDLSLAEPFLPSIYMVKKGLSALEGLIWLLHKGYRIRRALYLVDREHIKSFDEIENELKTMGCEVICFELLSEDRAGVFSFRHGSREVRLYVAVAGIRCNLEEEIDELIRRVFGGASSRMSVKAIFRSISDIRIIKETVKGLSCVLQALERDR